MKGCLKSVPYSAMQCASSVVSCCLGGHPNSQHEYMFETCETNL